jgi:anti-anti-sigma factor
LSGDVDVATVPHYAGEVISAARTAERVVTVDVSDVTFIDSAGLGLLADVLAIGTARGRRVVLQGASTDLHKLLLHCGMESLFSYR